MSGYFSYITPKYLVECFSFSLSDKRSVVPDALNLFNNFSQHPVCMLKKVTSFKYLGTTVSENGELEEEVEKRIRGGFRGGFLVSGNPPLCQVKFKGSLSLFLIDFYTRFYIICTYIYIIENQ